MTGPDGDIVRIEGLEFRYGEGDFRLAIPELNVKRGGSAAFIGPSGSGKTTLLHLIAGIVLPGAGSIETDGVGFFRQEALPELDAGRTLPEQVALCFAHHTECTGPTMENQARWSRTSGPCLVIPKRVLT